MGEVVKFPVRMRDKVSRPDELLIRFAEADAINDNHEQIEVLTELRTAILNYVYLELYRKY